MTKSVLIPLAPGFEDLEAITLSDLFVRAGARVIRAGTVPGLITASRGSVIQPDCLIEEVVDHTFDLILLPGGLPGADNLMKDVSLNTLLKNHYAAEKPIGAICAAPKVLVNNGIANGHKITCYPGSLSQLDTSRLQISEDAIVQSDKIYTSRGPGTAMDFALHLIESLFDTKTRQEVEQGLVR